MALSVRDLRDRLSAHLVATLGASGWGESGYPAELLPYDARPTQHRSWAIAVPSTVPAQLDRQTGRGGVARGTHCISSVIVRWGWWLRSDGALLDLAEAYDGERDLVAALLSVDQDPDLGVRLSRCTRTVSNGEGGALHLGTVELEVHHRLPLNER